MPQGKGTETQGPSHLRRPRKAAGASVRARIRSGQQLLQQPVRNEAELGELRSMSYTWSDGNRALLEQLFTTTTIADEYAHEFILGSIGGGFNLVAEASDARDWIKGKVRRLEGVVERLQFMDEQLPELGPQPQGSHVERSERTAGDAIAFGSLHPAIVEKCRNLYETGALAEAVEKSFKLVRDRLRTLTTYETGSDAFGKAHLYVNGSSAPHVDVDFQEGVKFLTMAIDRFRNEKSHTADGNITDPIRAYEYLRLSSLALHLLAGARVDPGA